MAFIAAVAALAVLMASWAIARHGLVHILALSVFLVLAVLLPLMRGVGDVGDRVRVDISGIMLLAAQALVGPGGAAVVGAVSGVLVARRVPWYVKAFNASQIAVAGALGGEAFLLTGGTTEPTRLSDVSETVLHLALPMLAASAVQAGVSLLLISGVVRVTQGVPMRLQMVSILRGTGIAYAGLGVIALSLVVLWSPAGLGAVSAGIVLAPLVVAQWVYRQRAEEVEGQQRALQVLVAAIEAKTPRLAGHSARVAELSGRMAQQLGLTAQQVADTRMAGMLHDVGQMTLPTRTARCLDLTERGRDAADYAGAGVDILDSLTFLHGALDPIRRHREALEPDVQATVAARIVALADRYDLLTRVGSPDGAVHAPWQARERVVQEVPATAAGADLIRALDLALARVRAAELQS